MQRTISTIVVGLAALASACGASDAPTGDDVDLEFEAGLAPEFIAYGFGALEPDQIEAAVRVGDEIRAAGRAPIVEQRAACEGEGIALVVATGDILRNSSAGLCDQEDPYIAIFVDPEGETFDPAASRERATPRLAFLLDLSDQLSPIYQFSPPVDARPVAGVVSLGSRNAADEIAALERNVMDAGGKPAVEEFDACNPVAAWVVDTIDDPMFEWFQGWTDCAEFTPHAAVYSQTT